MGRRGRLFGLISRKSWFDSTARNHGHCEEHPANAFYPLLPDPILPLPLGRMEKGDKKTVSPLSRARSPIKGILSMW